VTSVFDPVGARLAREGDARSNIDVGSDGLFAGKPRSYRFRVYAKSIYKNQNQYYWEISETI
jgi:hypothetical protein